MQNFPIYWNFFHNGLLAIKKNSYLCGLYLTKTFYNYAKNENKCRCKEAFYFHRHR